MAIGLCLAAGALHAFVATHRFTLAWQHSIEKVRWEEDYVIGSAALELREARIAGSGAGMEPPDGAVLSGGVWHFRPATSRLRTLNLARSEFVDDYELCVLGRCHPLSRWIPVSAGVTTLAPCAR
ncbi:MAG: DUF1850 domain-containing protein [Betaproteobacteria bacterium]